MLLQQKLDMYFEKKASFWQTAHDNLSKVYDYLPDLNGISTGTKTVFDDPGARFILGTGLGAAIGFATGAGDKDLYGLPTQDRVSYGLTNAIKGGLVGGSISVLPTVLGWNNK